MTADVTARTTSPKAPAPEPPRSTVRYPLDALRGLAALAVLTFHAYQNQFLDLAPEDKPSSALAHLLVVVSEGAVDMFFVLSGFLLFLPAARDGLRGAAPRSAADLLLRRVARLLPLYLTVVLVVWAVTNPDLPGHWQDLALHLTFTHIYSDTYIFWTDGPAWTLAVEFHFFLLMALLVPRLGRACTRRATRAGRIAVLVVPPLAMTAIGLTWLLTSIYLRDVPATDWSTWYGFLAKTPIFGFGMALALVVALRGQPDSGRDRLRPVRWLLLAGAVALVGWAYVGRPEVPTSSTSELWHLVFGGAALLLIAAVVLQPGGGPAFLRWRALTFLGGVSYGIYLLQEPIMRLLRSAGWLPERDGQLLDVPVTAAIVALFTLVAAWASGRSLEANGVRLLAMFGPGGSQRDYYPHLRDDHEALTRLAEHHARHPTHV